MTQNKSILAGERTQTEYETAMGNGELHVGTGYRERTQYTPEWKVKLISGSAAHREDGSHDVQITVQVNAIGHGNQLRVLRKLQAAPKLLSAMNALITGVSLMEGVDSDSCFPDSEGTTLRDIRALVEGL